MIARNSRQSQKFQSVVRAWHKAHAPPMPWRETRDPWHIFVSEVMLQQTQIPRVREMYPRFMRRFPTPHHMARAPLRAVLAAWQGMGYNRRAKYLKDAAKRIIHEHTGRVPNTEEALRALPGIGPYSARAILCFAHGVCKPFVETNIRRAIIHKFFPRRERVDDKDILRILERVQPKKNVRIWYWALMDYGRDALKHIPNPNRRSKHYTKQSKFEGSPRQIRAAILRIILEKKKATLQEIEESLGDQQSLKPVYSDQVTVALESLCKEGLARHTGHLYVA